MTILLTAVLLQAGTACADSMEPAHFSEISQLIDSLARQDKFSGTVLIARHGNILLQKTAGMAEKERNTPVETHTRFNIASVGKMFTSVAIAQLVEKGKLDYDDRVVKHLGFLPEETFGSITIAHLLSNTSGLGNTHDKAEYLSIRDTAKTLQQYIGLCLQDTLLFTPGTQFHYSNYGYILLGAVIEKITETSYFDYVADQIFAAAGMDHTGFDETDRENECLAVGYTRQNSVTELTQTETTPSHLPVRVSSRKMIEVRGTSAGGAYASAPDLHRFSDALLGSEIIQRESFERITRGRFDMSGQPATPHPNQIPLVQYGYGFIETFRNGERIVGHNGGFPGYRAQLDIYPDLAYTVVVLTNYDEPIMPLVNAIRNYITRLNH